MVAARLCFAAPPWLADGAGQVFEAGIFARLQLGLPAVALGDGLDEDGVDAVTGGANAKFNLRFAPKVVSFQYDLSAD